MANFYLLTSVLAKDAGRVTHTIPKASMTGTNLDKAKAKFFQKIYDMMKSTVDFNLIKCVVLGGPGEIRTEFYNWLQKHVVQVHDQATQAALKTFVNVGTKDIHRDALNGLLTDDQVKRKIANTKCAQHAKAFDDFQKMIANDETRAVYGPVHVEEAVDRGAVSHLLLMDRMFKCDDVKERKKWVTLVQTVENMNCEVLIYSSKHVTGEALEKGYGGLAALLRYPCPDILEIEQVIPKSPKKQVE